MEPYNRSLCSPMEPYGALHMEPYEALWNFLEPSGTQWNPMGPYVALWSHMEPHGTLWSLTEPMDPFGSPVKPWSGFLLALLLAVGGARDDEDDVGEASLAGAAPGTPQGDPGPPAPDPGLALPPWIPIANMQPNHQIGHNRYLWHIMETEPGGYNHYIVNRSQEHSILITRDGAQAMLGVGANTVRTWGTTIELRQCF